MKANVGIPDTGREAVGGTLNGLLADLHVMNVLTEAFRKSAWMLRASAEN